MTKEKGRGKMKVEIPKDKERIKQQIQALEWQIEQDTNEKDKAIHQEALKDLQAALKGMGVIS